MTKVECGFAVSPHSMEMRMLAEVAEMETARTVVAKGAAILDAAVSNNLLDGAFRNWKQVLAFRGMDLSNEDRWPLRQIVGDYDRALEVLGIDHGQAIDVGLAGPPSSGVSAEVLKRAWFEACATSPT